MTDLERIQIARAEEQAAEVGRDEIMRPLGSREPLCRRVLHGTAKCHACDRPATHRGYCKLHYARIARGFPVEDEFPNRAELERMRRIVRQSWPSRSGPLASISPMAAEGTE